MWSLCNLLLQSDGGQHVLITEWHHDPSLTLRHWRQHESNYQYIYLIYSKVKYADKWETDSDWSGSVWSLTVPESRKHLQDGRKLNVGLIFFFSSHETFFNLRTHFSVIMFSICWSETWWFKIFNLKNHKETKICWLLFSEPTFHRTQSITWSAQWGRWRSHRSWIKQTCMFQSGF